MKDEKLVPTTQDTIKIPLVGTVTTGYPNYKKLNEALQRDMRYASEELLSLRRQMDALKDTHLTAKHALFEIDRALAFLDCTDHLEDDDG